MRISDWSSDGCSSDLEDQKDQQARRLAGLPYCLKQRATAEFLIDEKADRDRKGDCHGRRFRRRRDAAIDAAEDQNRQQEADRRSPAFVGDVLSEQIGRASCWESVCQYV